MTVSLLYYYSLGYSFGTIKFFNGCMRLETSLKLHYVAKELGHLLTSYLKLHHSAV